MPPSVNPQPVAAMHPPWRPKALHRLFRRLTYQVVGCNTEETAVLYIATADDSPDGHRGVVAWLSRAGRDVCSDIQCLVEPENNAVTAFAYGPDAALIAERLSDRLAELPDVYLAGCTIHRGAAADTARRPTGRA
jgi:hypothetical protein